VGVVEALEVVDVDHRHRQRPPVAARAADQPGEPGQHVAAVEEAGERVLVQHRLEPAALADQLLLERLGARGGADTGDQLGGDDRLDQEVKRAAAEAVLGVRDRHLVVGDHHDGGRVAGVLERDSELTTCARVRVSDNDLQGHPE
jgi:hypothetical protein